MPGRGWANGKGLGVKVGVGASAGKGLWMEGCPHVARQIKKKCSCCMSLRIGPVPCRILEIVLLHVNIILVFLLCCYGSMSDVEILEICPFCREDFSCTVPRKG